MVIAQERIVTNEMAPVAVWDLGAEELRALGYRRDPRHLFGRFQRLATWDENGPVLSREARALADASLDLSLPEIVEEAPSADGSTRLVLRLADGARIEAVHMPRAVRRPRVTICLSSQVGCAMGCTFCATAKMGLVRNLAAHEIIGQLFAVMHRFGPLTSQQLSIVFMGMGEPLHNVDALMRALDVLCDPAGLGVAPSRITVSTAGHLAGLERLREARQLPELAVSVNAASDVVRRRLMPIDKKWPLAELRDALARWPQRPHQKITLEYVLMDGINDDLESADRLAAWIGDLRHMLNVIPFNAWGDARSPYQAPSDEKVRAFVARVYERGCLVTVRKSRGRDVRGACGTLVATAMVLLAASGCTETKTAPTTTSASVAPSTPPPPPAPPAPPPPSIAPAPSSPAPAASVELAKDPDLRIVLADKGKTFNVRVGQTVGVLFPHPQEFEAHWMIQDVGALGPPLTEISRGDPGVEFEWLIAAKSVGTIKLVFKLEQDQERGSAKILRTFTATLVVLP